MKEVYLTDLEWKMVTISFISMGIAYAIGFPLYFGGYKLSTLGLFNFGRGLQFVTLGLFSVCLALFLVTIVKLIVGEIKLHVKGLNKKQIKQVVTYCYPDINDKQFKTYYGILCKTLKNHKKSFRNMGFSDFLEADKWAQTEEFLTLERKWTAQLSKQYGMNIKY